MGHIRLGTLPRSKKWREVVGLIDSDASIDEIAEAAAKASELDLSRASKDPRFQFISSLLVRLPLLARAPGFEDALADLGVGENALSSVTGFLAGLELAIDRQSFQTGSSSDAGELAKTALLETLSVQVRDQLPSLFEPTSKEIRAALGSFASGGQFADLARDFFARLTYRSLDYYLSRELANHTGQDKRFTNDAQRIAFQQVLAQHTFEASRIVQEFAGGWYGKTVWQKQSLDQEAIDRFTQYAFKKMRTELGRRRGTAERHIKEGKQAINWTRLSCKGMAQNEVRLQLHALAYNLGIFLQGADLPEEMVDWSLTSLQTRLIKIGARVVRHARAITFQLAEVAVSGALFSRILAAIQRLRAPPVPI